ncbi:MAG: hypothetical protein LBT86_07005, partial [Deltaproteobacteria bacterium]|nr:hypothetical protein [Deltaproteobacteria bacterium]
MRLTDQDKRALPTSNSAADPADADRDRITDAYNDFILNEDSQLSPLLKKKLPLIFLDAEKGDASAQLFAGVACWKGSGAMKDEAEAFQWFLL